MATRRQQRQNSQTKQGEIIPPNKGESSSVPGGIYADIAAEITNYTDRPDLLLEVVEKHDPGFIKGMNDEARAYSRLYRKSRFRFGRFQSYSALFVSIAVALAILYIIYDLASRGQLNAWQLIGFAILYAVTQSGPSGWAKIVAQVVHMFGGAKGK